MRVILANPRGFCAGVNMAIESLDLALKLYGPPVYVYHEIVHNKVVVRRFERRGAIFVDDIEAVPEGANVLFSAHGVSPAVREAARRRRLNVIDATCPLVAKVHSEARRFAAQGRPILLLGHAGHDEVVGTMGEAPDQITLVEDEEDVERLELPPGSRPVYLMQTTLSIDEAKRIVERLRRRFPDIAGPAKDDICYATQNRQEAIHELAPEADLVIVLGSQNSSNSRRLAEIAQALGKPAYLIDSIHEADPSWFEGVETVVVTAGASAPEDVVDECVAYLQERYGAELEERVIRTEDMEFQLPAELRRQLRERSLETAAQGNS
ncbi:4-hydroxy-3-methylbut-2-enyl diphosphate reductase [bacterium HR29]|jgi:4-hydroxy-3-methylbut-2-enyl diphosphate reductase|nr:4-hydroxy-3-methylbut-2-enyl diphosphate reductase [bacterium HR29]